MGRHKSILTFCSLLLFTAMTLADTHFIYIEKEETLENREVEREELKEGSKHRHWIKLLTSGVDGVNEYDSFHFAQIYSCIRFSGELNLEEPNRNQTPLFIEYCRLKLHIS